MEAAERVAIGFKLGDRTYWVSRGPTNREGFQIVANGVLVDFASTIHYGEVAAFLRIARRLEEIQADWDRINPSQRQIGPRDGFVPNTGPATSAPGTE